MIDDFFPDQEGDPEAKYGPVEDILDLLERRFYHAHNSNKALRDDYMEGVDMQQPEGVFLEDMHEDGENGKSFEHIVLKSAEEISVTDSRIISRPVDTTNFKAKFHVFREVVSHPSTQDSIAEGYRPRAFVIYLESQRQGYVDACFVIDSYGLHPFDFGDRDVVLSDAAVVKAFDLFDDNEPDEVNDEFGEEVENDNLAEALLHDLERMPYHPFRIKAA